MNRNYYFTDETERFRIPAQPEEGEPVRLRFQTARADSVSVWLCHGEERLPLNKAEIIGERRFYEITVNPGVSAYAFYYEIREDQTGMTVYYDKSGLTGHPDKDRFFVIRPGYVVPGWLQGAVIYQIFTDRFRDGENRNDVQDHEYIYIEGRPVHRVHNWSSLPKTLDVDRFYGGDLPGIREKLDYLQGLGVEVLYLNPIFVSPSNHKYDSQDYDNVDPHLTCIVKDGGDLLPEGARDNRNATRYRMRVTDPDNLRASNEYFARFVEEIHRRGMRIILDGVFNHCGSFNHWMDREGVYADPSQKPEDHGAWNNKESRYRDYFKFRKDGSYEAWWNVKTLPKLNFENSEELQEEILRIAAKWVSPPYNVDGWRLDVAADLGHTPEFNHQFWKRFRKVVKKANPDAVILAEHYGDVSPWLQGEEWDTVMNYDAFMEPVTWFLTGMEKHSDSYHVELDGNAHNFWHMMEQNMARFSVGGLYGAMNQLDNHDHSRFLTRTNRRVGRLATAGSSAASEGIRPEILRQAVIIQMTWPGAPTLYYGDETGICGWTDPDCRRSYPWGFEDWHLVEFYKYAIAIHRKSQACRKGSLVQLYSGEHMIAYGRFVEGEQLVIIVNAAVREQRVSLDLSVMGVEADSMWLRIMETSWAGYNVGRIEVDLKGNKLECSAPPMSAVVYRNAKPGEWKK